MVTDCHVHLDDPQLSCFITSYDAFSSHSRFVLITNSTDEDSSVKNLELGTRLKNVKPFVGIHPQTFADPRSGNISTPSRIARIDQLLTRASGLGEIGIDPKYGSVEKQTDLFHQELRLAERKGMPISIHSRSATKECMDILSTFNLRGNVLFHWFSGDNQDLRRLCDRGWFASFGPSMLSSKRLQTLVVQMDDNLLLAETDSPLSLNSIYLNLVSTPFVVSSVILKMSIVRGVSFERMNEINDNNAVRYLVTQS